MTIETDPLDYAVIDEAESNSSPLPLAESVNGFADEQVYLAADQNALRRNDHRWKRWLDQTRAPVAELGLRTTFRTSADAFNYGGVGAPLERFVANDSHLIVDGLYVALTVDRLAYRQPAIKDYAFTASMSHHFYVAADGEVTVEVVALGTPASPPAGTAHLHTVDTDATTITAETTGVLFASPGQYLADVSFFNQLATFLSGLTISGGTLTLDKAEASTRRLAFTVDGDTSRGWRVEHTSTEALQFKEGIPQGGGGTQTTILALGAPTSPATPITAYRPLYVESAEGSSGTNALKVLSTELLGPGSYMKTDRTAALTLEGSGVGGVPLVLVPRSGNFSGGSAVGSVMIGSEAESTLRYKDNNGDTRYAWATKGGVSLGSTYSAVASNNFAAATAFSFNHTFVAGQRYVIRMRARVGRAAGSTRDAQFLCTVGGVSLAFTSNTVSLFQAGAAGQLEATWADEAVFTAGVGGSLAVQFVITPVNGAGNLNTNYRGIVVLGAFD